MLLGPFARPARAAAARPRSSGSTCSPTACPAWRWAPSRPSPARCAGRRGRRRSRCSAPGWPGTCWSPARCIAAVVLGAGVVADAPRPARGSRWSSWCSAWPSSASRSPCARPGRRSPARATRALLVAVAVSAALQVGGVLLAPLRDAARHRSAGAGRPAGLRGGEHPAGVDAAAGPRPARRCRPDPARAPAPPGRDGTNGPGRVVDRP